MARRTRRTTGPLDLRQQAVLRAIIEEYVTTATPVGSVTLVERYSLGVSSATVRNVLAELEAGGYLTHPHTSAGRIPTDAGDRYFIEAIIDAVPLPPVEQLMIRHQFGQVEFANEQWFRLAATTIAAATRAAGLATPAKPQAARVRRIDLVGLQDRLARLEVDDPNTAVLGRVCEQVIRLLRESDAAALADVFSDGLLNVMAAPEFAQADKLRRILSILENRAYLADLFAAVTRSGRVQVFIGRENGADEMSDVALVLAPYGRPGRAVGVVGVLGPTRMRYAQAIGTVRFVGGLMNELVDHLYA